MKEIIDNYFKRRYKFLISVAHNVNGPAGAIPYELHKDLVDDLYLYLLDKPEQIQKYIDDKGEKSLEAFCVRWIKNQSYWISDFKKKHNLLNKTTPYILEEDDRIIEEHHFVDDYYKDLLNIHSEEQIDKMMRIKDIYNELEQYEKNLFDLYITQDMTYEQICVIVGISKGTVHNLIKQLRIKIQKLLK